ncbi:TPA: host cell division inhibitory peptide Kil [Klebsiella oxytoca]|nr:host cell division inhibitory peptide Kil [Klebsiella oxytoca]HBU7484761.1 host cell division inhibitory peptide Kil [Klebsiella oxytoca]HBV5293377.1 host cell division inhibitory peptide Kil [Klebsiella oxytoca]HCK2575443.1 host cell division inhibitory peptide Kil [Klebsiella oxytoca]
MVLKMINHNLLRAAQSKAAIARYLQDGKMWMAAYEEMKAAIGYPWHRKNAYV